MHITQLRDIWAAESSKQGGTGRIDVLSWLSKATLDVIGLAGVYSFDTLDHCPSTPWQVLTTDLMLCPVRKMNSMTPSPRFSEVARLCPSSLC
jgi:hypothetical protein